MVNQAEKRFSFGENSVSVCLPLAEFEDNSPFAFGSVTNAVSFGFAFTTSCIFTITCLFSCNSHSGNFDDRLCRTKKAQTYGAVSLITLLPPESHETNHLLMHVAEFTQISFTSACVSELIILSSKISPIIHIFCRAFGVS